MASISTHVLDAGQGGSRPGVRVEVHDRDGSLVASAVADDRGRVDPLAEGLAPGSYRISWDLGGEFLASLTVTVHLREDRHYHVPALASGFAASVYLGG